MGGLVKPTYKTMSNMTENPAESPAIVQSLSEIKKQQREITETVQNIKTLSGRIQAYEPYPQQGSEKDPMTNTTRDFEVTAELNHIQSNNNGILNQLNEIYSHLNRLV